MGTFEQERYNHRGALVTSVRNQEEKGWSPIKRSRDGTGNNYIRDQVVPIQGVDKGKGGHEGDAEG